MVCRVEAVGRDYHEAIMNVFEQATSYGGNGPLLIESMPILGHLIFLAHGQGRPLEDVRLALTDQATRNQILDAGIAHPAGPVQLSAWLVKRWFEEPVPAERAHKAGVVTEAQLFVGYLLR